VDLLPTLAAWHGLPLPGGMDGIDWTSGGDTGRVRLGLDMTSDTGMSASMIQGRWKVVLECDGGPRGELFDREHDPREQADRAESDTATYLELAQRMERELGGLPCEVARAASSGATLVEEPSAQSAETAGLPQAQIDGLRALGYLGGPAAGAAAGPRLWLEPTPECRTLPLPTLLVRWQNAPGQVEVRVGAERKLFAAGAGAGGAAQTGPWVRPGLELVLVEAKSGRVLAEVRAGADPCAIQ
jgi:hypothetical protein